MKRKTKRVRDDATDLAVLRGGMACRFHGVALVAIDPGTSAGWAMSWSDPFNTCTIVSGQGDGAADVCREVIGRLQENPIGLLVVEKPFGSTLGRAARVGGPWGAGEARGRLAYYQADESCLWTPMAGQWRAWLGLAGGKREDVNERVHTWAEATLRKPLRTCTGAPEYDRANAVGMLFAARAFADSLIAEHNNKKGTT